MEDDDLAEMQELRKMANYKRHEEATGGPRKKLKLEEVSEDDDFGPAPPPIAFGAPSSSKNDIITISRDTHATEDEDSGDDFGPAPPPAPADDEGDTDDFGPAPPSTGASLFDNYRKRKVERIAKSNIVVNDAPKKRHEAIYVFGKDAIPEGGATDFDERMRKLKEAAPSGDFDTDVLLDDANAKRLPMRYEAFLRGHSKAISALAIDPAGVRLVSAGADYSLKFWDFSSMDRSLQSFRSTDPTENSLVHTLEWNQAGSKLLLASNTPHVQVLDREGRKQMETPKGYQFVTDMTHTTGHISPVTKAVWHPTDPTTFLSCSQDATVRFWNVEDYKKHKTLIKVKNVRGMNTCKPLCMTALGDGSLFAFAGDDGDLQVFPMKGPYLKPSIRCAEAHTPASETSDIAFVPGREKTLVSRGGDETLKVWDLRNAKSPLAVFTGLYNRFAETSICFNPSGTIVATGTSSTRSGDPGCVVFFDMTTLKLLKRVEASSESVIAMRWHGVTNQVFAGCGDGRISVLFDPEISSKGVLTALPKALRKSATQTSEEYDIIAPFAPQELNDRQLQAKARKEAASKQALAPVSGRGSQGLLGSNLKADFMKKLMKGKDLMEDPREALLRQQQESDSEGRILDYSGLEELNRAEQARADAIERATRSTNRK